LRSIVRRTLTEGRPLRLKRPRRNIAVSKLLGHTEHEMTEKVYRRVGEVVKPTK
jgi:hypothetical protein